LIELELQESKGGIMKKYLILSMMITALFVLSACTPSNQNKPTIFPAVGCELATDLGDGWVPVWCDEFSGDTVDTTKWSVENTSWGGGNQEVQYYSPNNITVEDGKLIIEARKETFMGKEYTSGRMNSRYKGDWLYGRVVARAKMPTGRGTWSAIWMLPTWNEYGTWPRSGEIDIMEYVGYDKNKIHGTIHTDKFNHNKGTQLGSSMLYPGVEDTFINYEMIWEPGSIKLYVDGESLVSFAYNPAVNQDVLYHQAWPFDQEFHLILNLAIGGTWGGVQGIDDLVFPTRMEVDYVRVYQKDHRFIDYEAPSQVTNVFKANNIIKNMIYWPVASDDAGVQYYEIYVDDRLHGTSRVNSFVVTGLLPNVTFRIGVVAVDFSGKKSEPKVIDFLYD
jgi:beta-glucanase (GH16 family)